MRFLNFTQLLMLTMTFLIVSSTSIPKYELNDKNIQKPDFPNYDVVRTFQKALYAILPVRQMALWGAFTYYGTKSTFGVIEQYTLCVVHQQDPLDKNCKDSLPDLTLNLTATVMVGIGIVYTNGWLRKKEDRRLVYIQAILMLLITFMILMISMLLIN